MDLDQRKKNRFIFLEKMYKEANGSENTIFTRDELRKDLSLDFDETDRIVNYLTNETLIEPYGMGGTIKLTHWGIKEVEQALENPDKPTEHFLPINIINIGTMSNSTLQQATQNSIINYHYNRENINELESIIEQLKIIQDTLNISVELHQELLSEIETLDIQKKSPKPKSIIINESLKTVRNLLENVVGNAITPTIIASITSFMNVK
jgi:hypothetical protein